MRTLSSTLLSFTLVVLLALDLEAGVLDPEVQGVVKTLDSQEEIPVIIKLSDRIDLKRFKDGNVSLRRSKLVRALQSKASLTQRPIKAFLKSKGVKRIIPLWAVNALATTVPVHVIRELAELPGIESIRRDTVLSLPRVSYSASVDPEWNIEVIRAPELWGMGVTGEGAVVAILDSGVDVDHPDLGPKWRGGTNSWFDPNGEHDTPYDATGHGTQVMGIIVGGDAGGSAIGVAPDARWIAVKIFSDAGPAFLSVIHQGFQWLLDPDGDPNTDDAPHVVNNSWGFEKDPGQCITEFESDIEALNAAQILVVFAAGNGGPSSATSLSPANYPETVAVGAVDADFIVPLFSSRGPSACDESTYPELAAPGVGIRTSDATFGGVIPNPYVGVSGTSFAVPHVTGVIALLVSAFPGATVAEIESALNDSAVDLGPPGPDNDSGYGLVDSDTAYDLLDDIAPQCTDADGDGYFAELPCRGEQDCDDSDATIYPGAAETKHDGVDQDCNGYDLTLEIESALYIENWDVLRVVATSTLKKTASLELVGYGSMKWRPIRSKWVATILRAGGNPETVAVSSPEGSESATTKVISVGTFFGRPSRSP